MKNISLIYALSSLAYSNMRSGRAASTKAGVLVAEPGEGPLSTIRDMGRAMGMDVEVIRMAQLADTGEDVRAVRQRVEECLGRGRATIFVLADAEGSPGDMLMRVTRVIATSNTAVQAVIMAIGKGIEADAMAMDVADGMSTSRDRIMGSSTFMQEMDKFLAKG